MRISPLPPFDNLVAFEAVSRHKSFTRAAKELNITQSAVSRRVLQLEEFIGRPLFTRGARALRLTITGQQYVEQIDKLLNHMSDVTRDVMKSDNPMSLTIACASGTASLWLAPRLPDFIHQNPNIKVRIIAREGVSNLAQSEYDVGIYYLRSNPPNGFDAQQIIKEKVHALCSPCYLGGQQLKPCELLNKTLLVADEPQRIWMTWIDWLSLCDVQNTKINHAITANKYLLLVQLAIQGQGLLLGWEGMIDPFIQQGLLVKASDASATLGGGYSLIWPIDRQKILPVRYFKKWVLEQVEKPQELPTMKYVLPAN